MNVQPGSIIFTAIGCLLLFFIVMAFVTEPTSSSDDQHRESVVVVFNSGEQECFNGANATIWDTFIRIDISGDSVQSRIFPQRRVHEVIDRKHPCK